MQNDLKAFEVKHQSELSQMLGYPINRGGHGPAYDAQMCREEKYIWGDAKPEEDEVKKWLLLLELGSHDKASMCWWDAGYLQFLIHQDDLAKLDFSRCYACIQTS